MNATKKALALKNQINDEIMRELQLGFRKDGNPSKLDSATRWALIDEYENEITIKVIGRTDEQIEAGIAKAEAWAEKVRAMLS